MEGRRALQLLWRRQLDGIELCTGTARPEIRHQDKAECGEEHVMAVVVVDDGRGVEALDARSGQTRWTWRVEDGGDSPGNVVAAAFSPSPEAGGRLVLGTDRNCVQLLVNALL